ncbi:gas vesicle protein GvpL [Natronobeatus ordinarius]|uniref:gas vesicle protein GvpL n=1 Tax=Natronobeatus ordinarius TaxID=2963433 RepID=UPI0020CD842F|nr:GvpL/GvpF family gas vesicle protein [Natronobeatus ordinarius]
MSHDRPPTEATSSENDDATAAGEDELPELEEGRYVYCVVRADEDATFEATGIEDEPVSIVTAAGVGAVVHETDEVYDSADLGRIRRWVVRHQSVVDEATEAFDTPLPFQFDTIVRGDDEAVRAWLREERERLATALDSLAGHREYRIEVVRTDPIAEERLAADDARLAELADRIDDADEGAAFLLEKQYDRRVTERRRARREALTADLRERLAEYAREVHELERTPGASLEGIAGGGSDEGESGEQETICRLTLLAHVDREDELGAVLDDVAAEPGLEVRFTGPWPPYTFAPAFGEESGG